MTLSKALLEHSSGATATLFHHGAHLTKWRSAAGNNWIFTSERALYDGTNAIRGGVPIIFPQFNEFGKGPRHGFARNLEWSVQESDRSSIKMGLQPNEQTATWPHQFQAEFNCTINKDSLMMALNIINTSSSSFEFTCALHTYFQIHSLETTQVTGLKGLNFWDNNGSSFSERREYKDDSLAFSDAIDRVYFSYQRPLALYSHQKTLRIEHSGFEDIVIWNPGAIAAKQMKDFADHEYQNMLCIEAAQIDTPVRLEPGECWQGSQYCIDLSANK